MQIGIPCGLVLLAAGEVLQSSAPTLGMLTQFGAVGVLGWVAWSQRLELVAFRKRLDRWDELRHEDSGKLNDTLLHMAKQCADTRQTLRQKD